MTELMIKHGGKSEIYERLKERYRAIALEQRVDETSTMTIETLKLPSGKTIIFVNYKEASDEVPDENPDR